MSSQSWQTLYWLACSLNRTLHVWCAILCVWTSHNHLCQYSPFVVSYFRRHRTISGLSSGLQWQLSWRTLILRSIQSLPSKLWMSHLWMPPKHLGMVVVSSPIFETLHIPSWSALMTVDSDDNETRFNWLCTCCSCDWIVAGYHMPRSWIHLPLQARYVFCVSWFVPSIRSTTHAVPTLISDWWTRRTGLAIHYSHTRNCRLWP